MQTMLFSTDVAEPADRLNLFRRGASDFQVDALGHPEDFAVAWKLLVLGELNVVEDRITPVRYTRTRTMIEADGQDRIAILYMLEGVATGTYDGDDVRCPAESAMVWDLSRPFEISTDVVSRHRIVTLPRLLIDEVLPRSRFAPVVPASPALALAFDQARHYLDAAASLPPASAAFHARALRDLLLLAILPAHLSETPDASVPLLQRVVALLDADLCADPDEYMLAVRLRVSVEDLRAAAGHFGGLAVLTERRRLLAAYRRLNDPAESSPVSTIADECGFTSPTLFSRRFKQVFGCSPRDLRLQGCGQLPRWAGAYPVVDGYKALLTEDPQAETEPAS